MSELAANLHTEVAYSRRGAQPLVIFAAPWLQFFCYAFAAIYGVLLLRLYMAGIWLVDGDGVPRYIEFTNFWFAGLQALHGQTATIYDPVQFTKVQQSLVGAGRYVYDIWPYPPTFFLILAPFAALPYFESFLSWDLATLLGCIVVVSLIVRRLTAIQALLASPFTAFNLAYGQDGLLTASLLGASLLFLERQPVLAGFFIGCLTYKPQFGLLIPLTLVASGQWRAFASAAVTAVVLALAATAAFGAGVWTEFPAQLLAQANEALFADPESRWGLLQSVYALIRVWNGAPVLAWSAQGLTTLGVAAMVWFVWRSHARYTLKAATLSAAALIATPYAYAYDMAVIAIPVAFLAGDQLRSGFLRGEQSTMIALFLASLSILFTGGQEAIGAPVMLALLCLIVRRVLGSGACAGFETLKFRKNFCEDSLLR
jgi:arabinofuranan 3-O-arabinosyltransferase